MADPVDQLDKAKVRQAPSFSPKTNLIEGVANHDMDRIKEALAAGADVNDPDPRTGLSALHIAVGSNDLALCRFLIEEAGASFFPDGFGRWPTLVAAECRVDDELSDYIVEKEAAFLAQQEEQPRS